MTDFDPAQHRMVSEQRWFEDFLRWLSDSCCRALQT